MAEQEVKAQGASLNTMFTYGIGTIAIGIKNSLLGTFLLLYFNQVLGLPAVLVASALAVALVVDAFSDPIVGIWSDRVRSRWGRRHPFIYAAIIPFTLSYYFILQNPGSISTGEITESELFVRLLVLLIIMRLSMTFYEVPRGALQPELTKDYLAGSEVLEWHQLHMLSFLLKPQILQELGLSLDRKHSSNWLSGEV